jgi:hypothetical protein
VWLCPDTATSVAGVFGRTASCGSRTNRLPGHVASLAHARRTWCALRGRRQRTGGNTAACGRRLHDAYALVEDMDRSAVPWTHPFRVTSARHARRAPAAGWRWRRPRHLGSLRTGCATGREQRFGTAVSSKRPWRWHARWPASLTAPNAENAGPSLPASKRAARQPRTGHGLTRQLLESPSVVMFCNSWCRCL